MSYTNLTGQFPYRALLTQFKMNALADNDHYFYTSLAQGGNADLLHSHSFQKLEEIKNNSPITINSEVTANAKITVNADIWLQNLYPSGLVDGIEVGGHNHIGGTAGNQVPIMTGTSGKINGTRIENYSVDYYHINNNAIKLDHLYLGTKQIAWNINSTTDPTSESLFSFSTVPIVCFYPSVSTAYILNIYFLVRMFGVTYYANVAHGERNYIAIQCRPFQTAASYYGTIYVTTRYFTSTSSEPWKFILVNKDDLKIKSCWFSDDHPSYNSKEWIKHPFEKVNSNELVILLCNKKTKEIISVRDIKRDARVKIIEKKHFNPIEISDLYRQKYLVEKIDEEIEYGVID